MLERDVTKTSGDRPARKIGEAPNIGKVLRSPQSGTHRRRGGLSAEGKQRRRQRAMMIWSAIFAGVSMFIIMSFVVSHYRGISANSKTSLKLASHTPDLEEAFSIGHETPDKSPGQDASIEIVEAALANRNPDHVHEYFTLNSTREPADVIRKLNDIQALEGKITRLEWIGTIFTNGMLMEQVVSYMETEGREVNRLAMLHQSPDGKWRINFDAYTRSSTPDWKTILARKSPVSEVRVFIAADTYYNGIYSDDKEWNAYALVSPDVEEILYGYVKRDTPAHRAIERILESDVPIFRATLQILATKDAANRQFEISRVLAENWVVGDVAYDEHFPK